MGSDVKNTTSAELHVYPFTDKLMTEIVSEDKHTGVKKLVPVSGMCLENLDQNSRCANC